ncbi:sensor histidine kinase [Sphaerisporangium corydalis]|uniref:histidine kinase n=1 Tax=Sphaerisporangium corydalis TaxID=1441875 RepID=A0ABV9EGB1_9ACTN|nr:HAMP domain-containing sensor histidine kinase [Sphaerisporangium corydalis]
MARSTLRTRLTLLYAGPFLLSGAVLLAVPIVQASHTVPAGGRGGPSAPAGLDLSPVFAASAAGLAVMVVASVALGWVVAGRFLHPLRTITATARDISASNLHRRLDWTGRDDEFTDLARTLDDLFERLEASFASQRRFVANASHELRTPLTAERALIQVALADPAATTGTLRAMCQEVLALGEAQEHLIDSLLALAGSEQGIERREPVDLARVAGDVVAAREQEAARRGVHVHAALAAAPASGDPRLIESLVTNLVGNALRHNTAGGRVEIATSAAGGRARVTVGNTGPLVPPDQVDRLFEPFQRLGGHRAGGTGGHGLGLAIVRAIARAHGATLVARARPGGGLDVEVAFS